jgi:hypothetical protein
MKISLDLLRGTFSFNLSIAMNHSPAGEADSRSAAQHISYISLDQ